MEANRFTFDRRRMLCGGVTVFGGLTLIPNHARAVAGLSKRALDWTEPDRTLLVLELSGGNDGLATIVPYPEDDLYKVRTHTGLNPKNDLHRIDDYRGMHPNLGELHKIYQEGGLAIVEGAGYPQPNHSHFTSQDIWHTASPRGRAAGDGWLGSLLRALYPDDPKVPHAVCMGKTMAYALQSSTHPVVCFESPSLYQFGADGKAIVSCGVGAEMTERKDKSDSMLARIRSAMRNASSTSEEVRRAAATYEPRVAYPNTGLGRDLKLAAALIQSRIGCRVVQVTQPGYDTHDNQKARHDELMTELSQGLAAFLQDVRGTETGDRVLVLAFSEFGRRVPDNASMGTDHGTAGPMFLAGAPAKGGLHGKHPSVQDLEAGDLKFTTDFRRVYASVLQDWFHVDSERVLGAKYETLPVVKA